MRLFDRFKPNPEINPGSNTGMNPDINPQTNSDPNLETDPDTHREPNQEEESLMFEMQQIGRRIASSRKQLDMTQQDLADQLGVTYQAVSNWERGLSIPDVLRLKDLAKLFQMSLDQLMGNEEDVRILEVAAGERKPESMAELASSAPYMKPSTLEKELLDQAESLADPADSSEIAQREIPPPGVRPTEPVIPIQSVTTVRSSFQEPAKHTDERQHPSAGPAPVTGEATAGADQEKTSRRISPQDLLAMAPFVSPEVLTKVVLRLITSPAGFPTELLSSLGPFLDPEQLTELVTYSLKQKLPVSENVISSLAPFLDSDCLHQIITEAMKNSTLSPWILMQLAPFMEPDHLDRIITDFTDQTVPIPEEVIMSLAPFLESETITRLIKTQGSFSSGLLHALLPFADEADLESLIMGSFESDHR